MPDSDPASAVWEGRFRTLFEHAPVGVVLADADSVYLDANPAACRMFGYARHEFIGLSAADIVVPAETGQIESALGEIHADRDHERAWRFRRRDGSVFTADVVATKFPDGTLIGIITDAALRNREVEGQLAESERRYRELVENANSIIVRWTADGRLTFMNEFGLRFFGFAPDEILGRPVTETIVPSTDTTGRDLRDLMTRIRAAPEAFESNINENVRKNGERVWIAWTNRVVRDPAGRLVEILSIGTDVTKQHHAEEQVRESEARLRESEERFRLTLERTAVGVAHVATDGFYLWANDTLCHLLGYTREELQRLRFTDLTAQEDREDGDLARVAMLEGRQSVYAAEKRYIRKDGAIVWVNVIVTFVRTSGQPPHFVTVLVDITERKKLEDQLRQAQKMEAVGRLAGGIAHDFNNLLTVISGSSEMLKTAAGLGEADRELVRTISDAGARAATLTRQLLGFSRRTVLQPRVLDVNAVVVHVSQMLSRLLGEDVHVETRLAPEIQAIKVDPGQLDQILMNLAVNARDAMPGGGTLTIETANVELGEDFVSADLGGSPGPHVMLAMTDTGTGMPPAVRERIFEPFFTTKSVDRGTGLGLSMVLGIVQQSGGAIRVDSELNRGTTFRIYFPAAARAEARSVAAVRPSGGTRGSETVLLVEDEAAVRALATRILQSQGYCVVAACDGKEALRIAQEYEGPIHLVLTDVVMPNVSGPELLHQLKAVYPGVKAIFMSGYTDDTIVRHRLDETKAAFIQKPYTPVALAQKVRDVLDS